MGPWSIKPHGHKRLFKFEWIRCTTCFTSPDNRQEKKTKPEGMYLLEAFVMSHVASSAWASARKGGFWQFETASRSQRRTYQGSERRQERRDLAKRLVTIRPTVSLYLDELLHEHVWIWKSGRSTFSLKRDASNGSMAPCRSHHGNHTRQEMDRWSDPLWTESSDMQLDR